MTTTATHSIKSIGLRMISHFRSPQHDTSMRCKLTCLGLVIRGKCQLLPTCWGTFISRHTFQEVLMLHLKIIKKCKWLRNIPNSSHKFRHKKNTIHIPCHSPENSERCLMTGAYLLEEFSAEIRLAEAPKISYVVAKKLRQYLDEIHPRRWFTTWKRHGKKQTKQVEDNGWKRCWFMGSRHERSTAHPKSCKQHRRWTLCQREESTNDFTISLNTNF